MNVSMQIGRGLAALALSAGLSAYAITHAVASTPTSAIPTLAAISVTSTRVAPTHLHAAHKNARCETSVVVGAPIDLGPRQVSR
jgi:hypothetical protein